MQKKIISIVLLLISYSAFSEIVPIESARKVAKNFYYERANSIKPVSMDGIKITQEFVEMGSNKPVLYIFNIGLDNGYIIVSAESNTIPVLAYSFEKNYFKDNLPPSFIWILESYKNEIQYTREKNLLATEEINSLWQNYQKSDFKSVTSIATVSPLLGNLKWDQGCYFNTLCPADADPGYCNHVPTGCVATAMAMIMKYNAWPAQGVGSYSYNHTIANQFPNNYGTLSANFGNSTYNWSAMPLDVTSANAEVAKIMYHCGVAIEMSYDIYGSGAVVGAAANYPWPTAQKAFVNNFKYPTASYLKKSSFTDANWKAKIKAEIDAARPILYAGDNDTTGHAFVLDGYQGTTNDYYHFNFGWGGYANGNFYLTSLKPNPGGIGGGSYNFTLNQEGIFNLIKGTTGVEESDKQNIVVYPNPSNGLFNIDLSLLDAKNINVEVYNIIGMKVWGKILDNHTNQIDLIDLNKGVYCLSVQSENYTFTTKISILK